MKGGKNTLKNKRQLKQQTGIKEKTDKRMTSNNQIANPQPKELKTISTQKQNQNKKN